MASCGRGAPAPRRTQCPTLADRRRGAGLQLDRMGSRGRPHPRPSFEVTVESSFVVRPLLGWILKPVTELREIRGNRAPAVRPTTTESMQIRKCHVRGRACLRLCEIDLSPSVANLRLLPLRLVRSEGEDIAHNPPRKKAARDQKAASSNSDERRPPSAGLWGSLVHPSGFGTPRRQFKSGQSHFGGGRSLGRCRPVPLRACA